MKKKTAVITISFLSAAVIALAALSIVSTSRAATYKRYVSNNYQHAFGELVTAMEQMDAALQKSVYATSPSMVSAVCTELFGKAMTAQMSLGVLPFSAQELERTSGFISRVGDYAFSLSRSASRGETYTEEQVQNLQMLSDTAGLLAVNLRSLQTDMSDGLLTMDELERSQEAMDELEEGAVPSTIGQSMRLIEKEFPETPSLIYDGPFSEHIEKASPKLLEGLDEVDENAARRAASAFTGIAEGKIGLSGECEGLIPCYQFTAKAKGGDLILSVTKKGGVVMNMLSSHSPAKGTVKIEDALKTAADFLSSRGYKNMQKTYYMAASGILTVNYAYVQSGVVCYSDLVKVAVSLDTGTVCGFEAGGYISTHAARELPAVAVSAEQARSEVPASLEVLAEQTALVPSDGKYETLCHEFKCEAEDGRHYIIYVNAVTGAQEKILILLEDENGSLTL